MDFPAEMIVSSRKEQGTVEILQRIKIGPF